MSGIKRPTQLPFGLENLPDLPSLSGLLGLESQSGLETVSGMFDLNNFHLDV